MVTPGFYPIMGGTETVVRNLSVGLNRVGVHVDVMTFNMDRKWNPKWKGKIEEIDGMIVFKVPALNWFPIEHSPRITMGVNLIPGRFTNILRNYDIVHFHEDVSFPLFSFLVRKHKIFHVHGFDVNFYKRYHLSRVILKHVADLYISLSHHMEKDLVELGIAKDKIKCLPNGINAKIFCPGRGKEDNLLLFVGRIEPRKGLHVLLESLRYLKSTVHLVIVGPPGWSPEYYQDILRLIKKENQKGKHKIEYLGIIDESSKIKLCQKASIIILPSFGEGLPVVILEALSCETPVIATPVGGVPEVIRDGENGILVPLNNPPKLAKAIQYLLDNKDTRIRLGREGRKSIEVNFSLDVVVNKLCQIYRNLLVVN
jgi:glycosyltransferase involved in cell wall biosynthesis